MKRHHGGRPISSRRVRRSERLRRTRLYSMWTVYGEFLRETSPNPIDWRKAQMQRALAWERLLAGGWADTSLPLVKRPIEMLEDGTYRYADTKMVRGVVSSEVGDAWFNGEPGFGHADR